MEPTGVDTTSFQARSTRSTSSTNAVELGHSTQDIKKHVNWSLNACAFEKFYDKPSSQESASTAVSRHFFFKEEQYHIRVNWD